MILQILGALLALIALAPLPYAIYVARQVRQHTRRPTDIDVVLRREIAQLRGYMSNQGSHLDEIQLAVGNVQRLVESLCMREASRVPATPAPAPVYTSFLDGFGNPLTPTQLLRLRQHLNRHADAALQIALPQESQDQLRVSPTEGLVENPSQEPKISHGGE